MSNERLTLVVGGGNGIGAACCEAMRRHGWNVAVADIDEAAAQSTAETLGGRSFFLDVRSLDSIRDLEKRVESEVGPIAALVVSSAIFQGNVPIEDADEELFDRVMEVNLRGTYHVNRVFGMRMAERGGGSIVNIASVTGYGSTPLHIYGPGKAAIINLTKSLAGEWGGRGVRVNSVSPGVTLVPRIRERKAQGDRYPADLDDKMALRRCVEPGEVAEAVEFLASSRASGITGTDLVVDCGWMTGALWGAYAGGLR